MPAGRRCPRCPTIIPAGTRYCPTCTRQYDQARGTRQQRGYDTNHDRTRAHWQARIDAGEIVPCARCALPINGPWALDHQDDRAGYLGPSHANCNNAAGGKAAHRR